MNRAEIKGPPSMTLELSDTLPESGVCCANTEEDFGNFLWASPATTYNTKWCENPRQWKHHGFGMARAFMVDKDDISGRGQAKSGPSIDVEIEWWNQAKCNMGVRQHTLAYAELHNGALQKPTNRLGWSSTKGAIGRGANLVIVEFAYAPDEIPENFCCCNPALEKPTCRYVPYNNGAKESDDWGMQTCEKTSKKELPVIMFSENGMRLSFINGVDRQEFNFPSEEECTNTAWDWRKIWIPKYRMKKLDLADRGIAVHGITEALLAQRAPSESSEDQDEN